MPHSAFYRYSICGLLLLALAGCASTEVVPTHTVALPTPMLPTLTPMPSVAAEPTEALQEAQAGWARGQFGSAWNILYPADWQIDAAGAHEGALLMAGMYQGHQYQARFAVPILGVPLDSASLESWVAQESMALAGDILLEDLQVAGVAAKRLIYTPADPAQRPEQRLYIWRSDTINPRLIVLQQTDGEQADLAQMQELLDQIAAGVE